MKKYTKPSMEIVDLRVEDKITAPTTFYKRGATGINLLSETTGEIGTVAGGITSDSVSF